MTKLSDWIEFNPRTRLEKDKAYPFIGMDVVAPGSRYVRSSEQRVYKGGGVKFKTGDILFARITPCLENGKIAQFINDGVETYGFGSTEFFVLRAISGKSLPGYVYYLAHTNFVREKAIKSMVGTSGRQRADVKVLCNLEIEPPSLLKQKRIVDVLSAYDDLIENNRRRMKLMEESARLLYHEWFVRFQFPGHEHVKLVGGVPEGWEKKPLPDVIDINPTERIERGKAAWYVPMSSLSENGMTLERGDFERRSGHTSVKFRNNDILLARITPCLENGKTGFVNFLEDGEAACGSTEFIVLRGRHVSSMFVYCLSRTYDFREHAIKSMIGTSGRQRVQTSSFKEYGVPLPPASLLRDFDDSVSPIFQQIALLQRQTEKLREARELLLPRLMSGEIEI